MPHPKMKRWLSIGLTLAAFATLNTPQTNAQVRLSSSIDDHVVQGGVSSSQYDIGYFFYDSNVAAGDSVFKFDTNINNQSFYVHMYDNALTYTEQADIGKTDTVTNFRNYAEAGFYDNTIIHRAMTETTFSMVQGGLFTIEDSAQGVLIDSQQTNANIENQYSALRPNTRGTISMARLGSGIHTASSQWFFNTVDNSQAFGNVAQNNQYAVFGEVLGNGMDVVDAMHGVTQQLRRLEDFALAAEPEIVGIYQYHYHDDKGNEDPSDDTYTPTGYNYDVNKDGQITIPEDLAYPILSGTIYDTDGSELPSNPDYQKYRTFSDTPLSDPNLVPNFIYQTVKAVDQFGNIIDFNPATPDGSFPISKASTPFANTAALETDDFYVIESVTEVQNITYEIIGNPTSELINNITFENGVATINYIPDAIGNETFIIRATNAIGEEKDAAFDITVLGLPGDVDFDKDFDNDDLIALSTAIQLGDNSPQFNVDGSLDGLVNSADGISFIEDVFGNPIGDFDLNGIVNIADLIEWANGFGSSENSFEMGDSNFDGQVNIEDLINWAQTFGQTADFSNLVNTLISNNAATAIPEPTTAILLLSAPALLLRRRKV